MRAFVVLSLAAATAFVSTAALAADGQGDFKRRPFLRQQLNIRPPVKPAGQGGQFTTFSRLPVQTLAPPISGPKKVAPTFARLPVPVQLNQVPAPTRVDFKPQQQFQVQLPPKPVVQQQFQVQLPPKPVVQAQPFKVQLPPQPVVQTQQFQVQLPPKPVVQTQQFQVQLPPKPVVQAPVVQTLPLVAAKRTIVPEAANPVQTPAADPVATGTLQAEIPADPPKVETPPAPQTTDKPADAQALIQGDAPAAPQAAPVAPQVQVQVAPAAPAPTKKRIYVQAPPTYYDDAQAGYGQEDYYQPRARYSYDNGYGGGQGYGGDNCQ